MAKRSKFSILEILILVIIAYSIMPIVSRFFSAYMTTYAYLGVIVITVLAIFVLYGQDFINSVLVIIIPILMLDFLIYVATKPSPLLFAYTVLGEILPIIIGYFIVRKESDKTVKVFAIFLLICLGITAITTIIGLQNEPNAARYLATVGEADEEDNVKYNWMNIGGYEFVYLVALIYPAIIYGFKRKKIHVAILIAYSVLDLLIVINAGYTIALLLFITSTAFLFFRKDLKIKSVVFILIIAVLATIILFPLVADGLTALADIIDDDNISERLRDIAGGTEGLKESEDNRLDLYMTSLNSFLSHPIFGGMFEYAGIGGHSFILDRLAQYGIFSLLALIFIYRAVYRKFFAPYKNITGYGFVFWTFLQAIVLSTVNTGMWLGVLTLFVPNIFAFINNEGNKYENSLDSKRLTKRV